MKVNLPKVYLNFIEECKIKKYDNLSTHKHHIIPKFMGGTNGSDNLIILSIEDHFLAHKILAENVDVEYKRKAWDSVTILKKGWGNNSDYVLEQLRLQNTGELNPFYGKSHSNETKKKMADNHSYPTRGKKWKDVFGNDKAVELGIKISKTKIGPKNPSYGKIWMHNPITSEIKYINKTDNIPNGWNTGMGKRNKKCKQK